MDEGAVVTRMNSNDWAIGGDAPQGNQTKKKLTYHCNSYIPCSFWSAATDPNAHSVPRYAQ